jgi:ATP-dependent Lon protease
MRKETLAPLVSRHIELSDNFKIRDEKSVKRVVSGLIKLLFPDGSFNPTELRTIIDIAVEYRQRVRDWLHKIAPGEFPKEKLSVEVKP